MLEPCYVRTFGAHLRFDDGISSPKFLAKASSATFESIAIGRVSNRRKDREVTAFADGLISSCRNGAYEVRYNFGLSVSVAADGRSIGVAPGTELQGDALSAALVDFAVPLALEIQGKTPVHSGLVVDRFGRGHLLLGASGTGKSTTCLAASQAEGWSVSSDDCCLVEREGDQIVAIPAYPGVRVEFDVAAALFGHDRAASLPRPRNNNKVRLLPQQLSSELNFCTENTIELASIVRLAPQKADPTGPRPVQVRDAPKDSVLIDFMTFVFKAASLGVEAKQRRFLHAADVVESLPCFDAVYDRRLDQLPPVLDAIEAATYPKCD